MIEKIRLIRLLKGAREHKNQRLENLKEVELTLTNWQKILINPNNTKRKYYTYFISILGVVDLFINIYSMFVEHNDIVK